MSDIDRSRLKKFKKEHPKEYREMIKKGKKEWIEYVKMRLNIPSHRLYMLP